MTAIRTKLVPQSHDGRPPYEFKLFVDTTTRRKLNAIFRTRDEADVTVLTDFEAPKALDGRVGIQCEDCTVPERASYRVGTRDLCSDHTLTHVLKAIGNQ